MKVTVEGREGDDCIVEIEGGELIATCQKRSTFRKVREQILRVKVDPQLNAVWEGGKVIVNGVTLVGDQAEMVELWKRLRGPKLASLLDMAKEPVAQFLSSRLLVIVEAKKTLEDPDRRVAFFLRRGEPLRELSSQVEQELRRSLGQLEEVIGRSGLLHEESRQVWAVAYLCSLLQDYLIEGRDPSEIYSALRREVSTFQGVVSRPEEVTDFGRKLIEAASKSISTTFHGMKDSNETTTTSTQG
ncbi:hypothetical protein HS1genome_1525 [Sulfodiicoccus acidiphilus]|uniref:Uncharacterized protein n=1 Tax=Sulfodiicoccus acidiphilus TaxID=1670455 RepID=A0A348B4N4_9CREN|nr:hypothetical protein [Sulfodiicoccus acidiphilus]BBD73136.1 hypothetical protein HS1genome_1525 [Sulfodiicoccus acidiphilus]GGU00558.1 hypothetical protein GCM10007116_17240 [Sulfodiicoccus acidiphilus]